MLTIDGGTTPASTSEIRAQLALKRAALEAAEARLAEERRWQSCGAEHAADAADALRDVEHLRAQLAELEGQLRRQSAAEASASVGAYVTR